MALDASDSDLVDLEAPLTPPPSMTAKRRAESPHPDESTSKRVLTEDAYTVEDAEDSDEEFVDAQEEITTDYNSTDRAHSSAAFGFADLVNIDDPNGANGQTDFAQPQTDGFSGDGLEQYDYGGQDPNDFSDILGPHGYGNGLTDEEIEAQGITAEQHLEFTNGFIEHDEQQLGTEPNELPTREEWSQMSAAEQDVVLNRASNDAKDEPMFITHAQDGGNGAGFFPSTFGDELQPNALPVDEQYEYEAMGDEDEEDDAQLGAQQDPLDDEDNLFSTTFGAHTEVLSDGEEDESHQQPQGIIDEHPQVAHSSGTQAVKFTQPPPKTNDSSTDIIDLTESSDQAVMDFLNESKWVYDAQDFTPPPPPSASQTFTFPNNINKTSAQHLPPAHSHLTAPTLPRDLSKSLRAFQKFHTRVLHLIPHLPNWSTLPTRRYWIAILHLSKNPTSSSLSEKDFLWLKGNKFSTISTIWNSYQTRSMCDPEDFVLVARGRVMEMETRAEEMDVFGERLVVLRAMRKAEARGNVARLGGLLGGFGVVPEKKKTMEMMGEVIELD
ncbi:hypothetical protein AC578_6706 [Pseudocercospora eumusae]|uniref:Uncharacterized protein n=1 Tax=Pseudocercospora eumusae TaxID=321146 RepID=A0A139HHY6_9PEZI|nr:hypothetical protein AC578_6706 [Pseudocercospora eumusae]